MAYEDPKQVEDSGQGLRCLPQGEWSQVWNLKVRHVAFQVAPVHNVLIGQYDGPVVFWL